MCNIDSEMVTVHLLQEEIVQQYFDAAYTKTDHIDKVHLFLGLVENTKDNRKESEVTFHLLQGLIESVVINDQREIGSLEQPLEKSVEMGSVHFVQEEIVKKDLFKPPKDIINSIEQNASETKTVKKHFLDKVDIEKEEPLKVRNSVNLPYLETPGNMSFKDSVETPEDSPEQILGDAQEDQVLWKNLDDHHTKVISQS